MLDIDITIFVLATAVVTLGYAYFKRAYANPYSSLPLPPSRKGYPIIGNLLEMPPEFEWKTYHKWSKELGTDILYINVLGTSLVVLDSSEAATDLLERRSSRYSGRARMPMINELMGWDFNFAFTDYGVNWRRRRRVMHNSFHPTASLKFRPYLIKAARNFAARFLDYPDDIIGNARHMAGETIMSISYGLNVKPTDDPYIKTAEQGVHPLVAAAVPGAFLVDTLPLLKYVPEWMPGAGFKTKAREWKILARTMVEAPYAVTKQMMADRVSPPCFVRDSLLKMNEVGYKDDAYREEVIQDVAGTMYAGGSDTTSSAVASCILGLLDKPEVLAKAQRQLDAVVKPGYLPDFDDEDSLPYITAIVKETLRWRDVVPIAVPHRLTEDDEYRGYRLPKNSIIIPNGWAMLHNEEIYPDPFTFNPDRFLNKDGSLDPSVRDPAHACWGFERRICPGRYMAFSQVWIAVATLLTVYDIQKAVDKDGRVIEPVHEYTSAIVSMPKAFKCSITARSKEAEKLLRSSVTQTSDIF